MAVRATTPKAAAPKAAAPRIRRISHPSLDERLVQGRTARDRTPPSSHAGWSPATDRPDPVALLEEQNLTREKDLVPVRHGRMMVSPFTVYRGAAKIMAADLKDTPVAGLDAQLCGDAHLSSFGAFASPERRTQSPLRSTWAQAMRSTHRSPTSPSGTPIRTSGTIRTS